RRVGEVVLAGVLRAVGVGLGHAVADVRAGLGHGRHAPDELRRRRGPAPAQADQAGGVELAEAGRLQQVPRLGGHADEVGDPLAQQPSMTGTAPVTWNSGTMRMNTGGADGAASPRRRRSTAARQLKPSRAWVTARWVDTAPFGRPVVPEV